MEKQSRQKLESSLNGIQFEEKNDQKKNKKKMNQKETNVASKSQKPRKKNQFNQQ